MQNSKYHWCVLFLTLAAASDTSLAADDKATAKQAETPTVSQQLLDLTVPVMRSGRFLGEVAIKVNAEGSDLMVKASHLITLLQKELTSDAKKSLEALPAGKYISASEAKALGLNMQFDMASASVVASILGSARSKTSLSLAGNNTRNERPNNGREPRSLSGYLNIFASSSASDFDGDYQFSDPTYSLESALHIAPFAHMTLEAFGYIDAEGDFDRGDIRGVWHSTNRENDWRLRVGDVSTTSLSYMGGASLQGVEFTNSDTRRRSRAGVGNVGNNEFFLERPAVARLIVDGNEVRRYNLEPGPYDVKDFPLANGANNVAFIIEDERGEVDRIEFNAFTDTSLSAPGEYNYSFSVGRGLGADGNYRYDDDNALLSGFFETGVTNAFSVGAGLQLTEDAQLGVGTAKLGTPFGRFDFQAAGAFREDGQDGEAAKLTWRNNRNTTQNNYRKPYFGLSASYQSEYFDDVFDDADFNEEEWRFDASYSQPLARGFSGGISSNYTQNRTTSDTYKHTFSLGKSFKNWSLGGNVSYLDDGTDIGWEGGLNISYDFGKRATVSGRYNYDVDGKSTTELNISSNYSNGLRIRSGVLDYDIGLSADKEGDGAITGGINYTGNRYELSASHSTGIDSLVDGSLDGQRTTFRLGTSIAFAEGVFGFGRPINDNFALFHIHQNIKDQQMLIGSRNKQGVYHVQSDGFGPIIADLGGYSFQDKNIGFDVNKLPLGYDLGTGLTSLAPRYKSGLAVKVGSAYNVIAIAQLLDSYDRPLKLLLGKATEIGVKNPRSTDAFTDSKGMLSASGLAPGRWKVEMFAKKPVTYILNIPKGQTGLVELGKIKPSSGNK